MEALNLWTLDERRVGLIWLKCSLQDY